MTIFEMCRRDKIPVDNDNAESCKEKFKPLLVPVNIVKKSLFDIILI